MPSAPTPRRGGNSEVLCDEVLRGAAERGHAVEKLRLAEKRSAPCLACSACADSHDCVRKDDMAEVLAALKANPKAEKGEYCLVMDFHKVTLPEVPAPRAEVSLEAQLVDELLSGKDLRAAQTALMDAGQKKNAVKAAALRLKKLLLPEDDA